MNELGFGKQRLINEIIKQTWNTKNPSAMKFTVNDVMFILQELQDNGGRKYFEDGGNKTQSFNVFKMFAQQLLYRNIANYDSMVLITASKGAGKSSLAILLARLWCQYLGIRFDPKRHIAYNNADIMERLDKLEKFEPIVLDEGVRFACLSGDTNIKTKHGEFKIRDLLYEKDIEVLSFNEVTNIFEYKKAEKCIETGEQIVYEIETEDGKKIKATENHLFLTKNGWVKLKDLKEGDEILHLRN